ncbi:hypothetical protein ACOMHN_010328 [Nucella lapillus]
MTPKRMDNKQQSISPISLCQERSPHTRQPSTTSVTVLHFVPPDDPPLSYPRVGPSPEPWRLWHYPETPSRPGFEDICNSPNRPLFRLYQLVYLWAWYYIRQCWAWSSPSG